MSNPDNRKNDLETEEWIELLKKGDSHSFRTLVETYKNHIYNVALGFLKIQEEAEDISQEIFIHLHERIRNFKGDSKLSTWIYRITVNTCLEKIRRNKRQKRWAFLSSIGATKDKAELQLISDFEHPGIALENKERAKILMLKIEQLPENQRIAFTLNKIEGLSYKEIAEIMELSLSAVESSIYRANQNLRKTLENYYRS